MNRPGETAGKIAALLIFATAIVALAYAAFAYNAPQPRLPIVEAAADCAAVPMCKPAGNVECEPRKGPFGGVDPDAGEKDNRRIA